jgi:hypothetical protein
MGMTCNIYGKDEEMHTERKSESLTIRGYFTDPCIDGGIILKQIEREGV